MLRQGLLVLIYGTIMTIDFDQLIDVQSWYKRRIEAFSPF
jgi:hypothetical protein